MNAVIYTRGQNRKQQINECKEYAKRFGFEVVGIESNWDSIEYFVFTGKTDIVIVYDIARITRKQNEFISIVHDLDKFDVRILSVN